MGVWEGEGEGKEGPVVEALLGVDDIGKAQLTCEGITISIWYILDKC